MRRLAEFRNGGLLGRVWLCWATAACVGPAQASDPIDNSPRDNPSLVAIYYATPIS